jgi:hypothetical protein
MDKKRARPKKGRLSPEICAASSCANPSNAWMLTATALGASTPAAVTGFGGAAVLRPALIVVFGVREAIPILTVAQLIGNGCRVQVFEERNDSVLSQLDPPGPPIAHTLIREHLEAIVHELLLKA